MHKLQFCLATLFSFALSSDPNGYIVYCPCMGRFGNQAEQFLGTLQFAKHLNRTLVLPPFIEYDKTMVNFVPFQDYIKIDPLLEYHRVIDMETFMKVVAPTEWPSGSRQIYCYASREGLRKNECNAFEGNPFKPFWNYFNITSFDKSIFYAPLQTNYNHSTGWTERFRDNRVVAFVGAPSSFPTNEAATTLQQYVELSDKVAERAEAYRKERRFDKKPYIGLHLRHGSDWEVACKLLESNEMTELFSSKQCTKRLTSSNNLIRLPYELCLPSKKQIIGELTVALKVSELKTVYIATDINDFQLWSELSVHFKDITFITPVIEYLNGKQKTTILEPSLITDLYLLSHSDFFIGNCISSFSAFCSRTRELRLKFDSGKTKFFGERILDRLAASQREDL